MTNPATVTEPRWIPVWAAAAVLKRSHRTIRTWVAAGKVPSTRDPKTGVLLVDGQAATLHHEQTATRRRVHTVSVVDTVKSSKSSSVLQNYAKNQPGRHFPVGFPHFREVVITEQTPPPEIVIPVRLDLSAAAQQLDDFVDHLRVTLGSALGTAVPAPAPAGDDSPPPAA